MQGYVYYRCASPQKWAGIVDMFRERLTYLYAESDANLYLSAYSRPDSSCAHGRAFGETLEVRWTRRAEGQIDLTLLSESLPCPEGWLACTIGETTSPLDAETGQVILAGVHRSRLPSTHAKAGTEVPDEWIETRIPRPLVYPMETTGSPRRQVCLQVVVYRAAGRPILTRMAGVKEMADG